jgi:hypothetical protein
VPAGVVLLAPGCREPVLLGGTGEALWDALGSGVSLHDLTAGLAVAHQAETAAVEADVEAAVARLLALGVVQIHQ